MVYPEYAKAKAKYEQSLARYNELLDEKEQLFVKTQPKGIDYTKDVVKHSTTNKTNDMYLIALERSKIDERLKECNIITNERKSIVDLLEAKLGVSNDTSDKIYRMFYLEKLSSGEIGRKINYSRVQVWRKLSEINKIIEGV